MQIENLMNAYTPFKCQFLFTIYTSHLAIIKLQTKVYFTTKNNN